METCRACLCTGNEMIPLDDTIINKYNLLTNLSVSLLDGMPHFICNDCLQNINVFVDFRSKCIYSESVIQKIVIENIKTENTQSLETENDDSSVLKIEIKSEWDDSVCEENTFKFVKERDKDFILLLKKNKSLKGVKNDLNAKRKRKCKKYVSKHPENLLQEPQELKCGICVKSFLCQSELFEHLEVHKTERFCKLCLVNFTDWPGLLAHRLIHIPQKQRRCHICSKFYISYATMEYHYRKKHYKDMSQKLKCFECDRKYDTPRKLQKHIWSEHSKRILVCDYCSKTFHNKQRLKMHIIAHNERKAFTCDICEYSCKFSSGMKAHKIRKHSATKVYCENCKTPFLTPQDLEKHKCKVVSKVCPICGKEVTRSTRMARHMQSHVDEKRYKCLRCPAKYKSKTALAVHIDRHDGIRRKQCEFCQAKFFSAGVLQKHRRIHTGERPYVCKICQRTFTGNSNLKVHMKVHGEFLINKKDPLYEEAKK